MPSASDCHPPSGEGAVNVAALIVAASIKVRKRDLCGGREQWASLPQTFY